ncbi:MAG: tRNA (N6-isopentenyl adenosine(37)-C2)-methylthiotransferase MiaB [Actinobacteria bacterium RBG_16_64_13]|nr:MAG: tRNA (N6-isopentenyl adenosine(37)-C2)-methylthiotransferase MiaB [Actinobacteria bacterium RBG_16_64_13]
MSAPREVVSHVDLETYYLRSFGCQMNDHDSERIAGLLEEMGLSRRKSPEEAGLLVYNTCSIREKADSRLAGHLGAASRLKKEDPSRVVVVAGCLAQSRRDEFFGDFPFVDVLVGPQSLHELPGLVRRRANEGGPVGAFQEQTTRWSADLPRTRVTGPSAWVQITAGCSNYCSYCIVPYVRGPEASRPAAEVLEEVTRLAGSGIREVTLLGQNVNAYGNEPDFAGKETFAGLLGQACQVRGIERVRFMTSHPKDVSDALVHLLGGHNQVCEHLHLPVQSGSDGILHAMRRGYDRAAYLGLARRLREAVPGLALTTDLIVAFPGETEADFAETLSLVEECRFDGAFTFVYSPRRRTAAAELPGRVAPEAAQSRMERLVEVVQRIGRERNEALVGQISEVMVERASRHERGEVMGRTRTHKPVNFVSTAGPGDFVLVELLEATSTSFRGRQVS